MVEILAEYETYPNKKPRIYWAVFIIYSTIIATALVDDLMVIWRFGWSNISEFSTYAIPLDPFQLLILYGFFRRSKIAWSLLPLIQGFHAARFIAYYYTILNNPLISPSKMVLANPIIFFFCIACTLVTILCFHPKITAYFELSKKLRLTIMCFTFLIMVFSFLVF